MNRLFSLDKYLLKISIVNRLSIYLLIYLWKTLILKLADFVKYVYFLCKNRNPASKRIFDAIQTLIEFIVVFVSILLEFIRSTVESFLPQKLKDISGEIVLVRFIEPHDLLCVECYENSTCWLDYRHRTWYRTRIGITLHSRRMCSSVCWY